MCASYLYLSSHLCKDIQPRILTKFSVSSLPIFAKQGIMWWLRAVTSCYHHKIVIVRRRFECEKCIASLWLLRTFCALISMYVCVWLTLYLKSLEIGRCVTWRYYCQTIIEGLSNIIVVKVSCHWRSVCMDPETSVTSFFLLFNFTKP